MEQGENRGQFGPVSTCIEKGEVQNKDSGVLASDALQQTFTGLLLLR
jgi:hypothetical protein